MTLTDNHKTQTVPISTAVTTLVAGGEFYGWDDPNLEIAITQVAEKITINVNAFMAYLELYRDLDEELPHQDAAVASPKSTVSRLDG